MSFLPVPLPIVSLQDAKTLSCPKLEISADIAAETAISFSDIEEESTRKRGRGVDELLNDRLNVTKRNATRNLINTALSNDKESFVNQSLARLEDNIVITVERFLGDVDEIPNNTEVTGTISSNETKANVAVNSLRSGFEKVINEQINHQTIILSNVINEMLTKYENNQIRRNNNFLGFESIGLQAIIPTEGDNAYSLANLPPKHFPVSKALLHELEGFHIDSLASFYNRQFGQIDDLQSRRNAFRLYIGCKL